MKKGILLVMLFLGIYAIWRYDILWQERLIPASSVDSALTITQEEPSLACREALDQRYTFLGNGKQALAFLSEDGTHVLKLFRKRAPKWHGTIFGKHVTISFSKLPFFLSYLSSSYQVSMRSQAEKDFESYWTAWSLLREETQLEYLHLVESTTLPIVKVTDRQGVLRHVDLNRVGFLLQKKVDLLYPKLQELFLNKQHARAKDLLSSFAHLLHVLTISHIDNPTIVSNNYGCLGSTVYLLDVGRVLVSPTDPGPEKASKAMLSWLQTSLPEYYPFFQDIISKSSSCNSF